MIATCIESLLIFLICIFLYPTDFFTLPHLTYLAICVSLLCFEIIANRPIIMKSIGVCILFLSILNPTLLIYTPAFSYVFFYRKNYVFPIIFSLFYLVLFPVPFSYKTLFFVFTFGLSFYLAYQNSKREHLETLIKHLRDSSMEQEIALKKQNHQLIENQNDALYIATLQERNRIAREIHDNVGHMLSRSILQLGALLSICKDETLRPHLITLKDTLNEAMTNIRNSVHDLHDESVRLDISINNLLQAFTFCPVKFTYKVDKPVPKTIKYCFLSIIKEALNNIMKHSNATNATLIVKEHFAFYQLIIEDNGTTSLISNTLNTHNGIGLTSMRERVAANQGVIHITTDQGFRIFITIPK